MAKVRLEWVRLSRPNLDRGAASNDIAATLGAQLISVTSSPVRSTAAPTHIDADGQPASEGFARIFGLSGAVNLAWGASPTAGETDGVRLEAGQQVLISISAGQYVSFVQAADTPAVPTVTVQAMQADASSRSGAIATGGAAQDFMAANATRRGWEIQNQSSGNLWVRSKGTAGASVATQDQNSLLIPAGALYTADAHVTPNALSIIGVAAGQAFYAREW